ncbi:substrate-binding domain-containing protein [Methylobacterium sp. E-041]|uniref:substrate-binding domain-containing protein n=1 Tax=Methylobacterium sp. E-041 TaxID=2836573 RepID=UPI0028BDC6D3|nr:substrate-binding domain-containing protein [Methylobacterium sp. E-041]
MTYVRLYPSRYSACIEPEPTLPDTRLSTTHRTLGTLALIGTIAFAAVAPARAEPVRIFAAGSLVAALKDVIAASGLPSDAVAAPVFGPAGLMRQRIEGGEKADLFLSADLTGPRRLAEAGKARDVVPFARNKLCVLARADLGLTSENLLDRLLKPDLRLATSTPGADPGGDYAQAVFDRAEAIHPGAKAILERKALRLLGSPNTMVPVAGRSPAATVFLGNNADALLYYCSGQKGTMQEAPGLSLVPLPPHLSVPATYGMALLSDSPDAARLAVFLVSEKAQAILARHELGPIAAP